MNRTYNTLLRILAVFAASGLSVIGAGAIAGVSTIKAVLIAGITGVATVVEKISRSFLDDGQLDQYELDAAFSQVDPGAPTVAEEIVKKNKEDK